jgi:hypothetical protein
MLRSQRKVDQSGVRRDLAGSSEGFGSLFDPRLVTVMGLPPKDPDDDDEEDEQDDGEEEEEPAIIREPDEC